MQVLEMIIARGGRGMSRAGGEKQVPRFARNDKIYNSE